MNTLKTKSNLTKCYSFEKRIPVKKTKKKWNDDFKGTHGTANFFEVAIGYSGAKSFFLEEENEQEWSHEQNFVLVNLYKAKRLTKY